MKHKLVIAAAVATTAVVGGGAAVALADDDAHGAAAAVRAAQPAADVQGSARVTAAQAITAALEARPGTAVSADLDTEAGDDDRGWEVDILGTGTTSYTVRVDPANGRILGTRTDRDDADDVREARALLKGTGVTAAEAAGTAAAKGAVTSVDLDDDGAGGWDVETDGSSSKEHDWKVGLKDGRITADRHDDGPDDQGSDDTDGADDSGADG